MNSLILVIQWVVWYLTGSDGGPHPQAGGAEEAVAGRDIRQKGKEVGFNHVGKGLWVGNFF